MNILRGDTKKLPLSPRQIEILQLLSMGLNDREVAHMLGISCKRVRNHRDEIMIRTGCRKAILLGRWVERNLATVAQR